jgi:DNA-binding MarR family transcriptional regulator
MTEPPNEPRGCTNFKLRQLLRAVSRRYDGELAKSGLKTTQYSMLTHILKFGPIQPKELARRMGMDVSTLSRNLAVLVSHGWAAQGPGADARSRSIEITPAGRAKRQEAHRHWKSAQRGLNEALGVERVAALHQLIDGSLERIAEPQPESIED